MKLTTQQREHIEASIRDKYQKVAAGMSGQFRYPTGEAGLEGLGYHPEWYSSLPKSVRACFCGVGNPFSMGLPEKGWMTLDVGSGCGVDVLISAGFVATTGRAFGIEASLEMLAKSRENASDAGASNVEFIEGTAEILPFPDASFNFLTSSGVYNLVINKEEALAEAFRVIKPGGRLQVADQILTGPAPLSPEDQVASWFT